MSSFRCKAEQCFCMLYILSSYLASPYTDRRPFIGGTQLRHDPTVVTCMYHYTSLC